MDVVCRLAALIDVRRNRNRGAARAIQCPAGALMMRLTSAAVTIDQVMKDAAD
jgi:hypothetical protein